MNKINILLALILTYNNLIFSQKFTVKYTNSEIIIDGVESEKVWKEANTGNDFWQWRPADNVKAKKKTEFKAIFDDENLYFLVKSFTKEKLWRQLKLKRCD